MCNYIVSATVCFPSRFLLITTSQGNERWVEKLETNLHAEFSEALSLPWVTLDAHKQAGLVRQAGGGKNSAGNVTFVNVWNAGSVFIPFSIRSSVVTYVIYRPIATWFPTISPKLP